MRHDFPEANSSVPKFPSDVPSFASLCSRKKALFPPGKTRLNSLMLGGRRTLYNGYSFPSFGGGADVEGIVGSGMGAYVVVVVVVVTTLMGC